MVEEIKRTAEPPCQWQHVPYWYSSTVLGNRDIAAEIRGRSPAAGLCCAIDLTVKVFTEVELLSFVCSTGGKGYKPRLWNIQNLGPVPP